MSDSFATPWTVAHQAPLSMGFPQQEYWSGLPFPSPGDLPNPGIDPGSLAWQLDSLPLSLHGSPQIMYIDIDIIGISLTRNKRLYIFMLVIAHLLKQVRDSLLSNLNPAQGHCKV